MWQVHKSTPLADIAVNRHQSSISSLEMLKYFEVPTANRWTPPRTAEMCLRIRACVPIARPAFAAVRRMSEGEQDPGFLLCPILRGPERLLAAPQKSVQEPGLLRSPKFLFKLL